MTRNDVISQIYLINRWCILDLIMTLSESVVCTVLETIVLSCILTAALIGNVSLLLIVYKKRNLWTVTNMFIVNLAVADLLVSVLSMPTTLITIIKQRWMFGLQACVASGYITILSFIASVMSLAMIAINRYFHIVKWNTYNNTFSRNKASVYIAVVWVVSMSLACPPLFGWAEYRFMPEKSYCFVYWPSNVYFLYFMITVCFFGPLLVIAFSYFKISMFTRNARRKIAVSRNNLTPPVFQGRSAASDVEPKMSGEENFELERSKAKAESPNKMFEFRGTTEETRITNTFLLMVGLFIFSWAPFAVTMFFDVYYSKPLPRTVHMISMLFGYGNSACNPILYGVRNSVFKREFIKLYSKCWPLRL